MPSRGETWIKTQTGWRTLKTIVINNHQFLQSPISSDSETEESFIARSKNVAGVYWQSGPPFVILPGDSRTKSEFFFISRNTSEEFTNQVITSVFNKLKFKPSVKCTRRFNYIAKLLEVVLSQDLISVNASSQKRLMTLFEQFVSTVLSTEINVHIVKRLLVVLKEYHYCNKTRSSNARLWNHFLDQINLMERKIDKFKVKKLCKNVNPRCFLKITDLPVDALRLILRCFSDHQDIGRLALVNRYFYKLTQEAGLWKSLCIFHLPDSKHNVKSCDHAMGIAVSCIMNNVLDVHQKLSTIDRNIPSSWKTTYRKNIRRSCMRHVFAETLVICSHCHFIFWKNENHICSYDRKITGKKVPIIIPITPKGFCHLFEK